MSLPTPKWKEKAAQLNAAADAEAESLLDKLKASHWTAVIIGGTLGAVVVLAIFALFVR